MQSCSHVRCQKRLMSRPNANVFSQPTAMRILFLTDFCFMTRYAPCQLTHASSPDAVGPRYVAPPGVGSPTAVMSRYPSRLVVPILAIEPMSLGSNPASGGGGSDGGGEDGGGTDVDGEDCDACTI